MFSQSAVFDDVNQHAHSLQNWPQEYNQLSSGKFEGFLEDIQLDSVRVFRERMKQSVVQNTHTPTGKISLMIPHRVDASDTSDQARQIMSDGVTLLPYESDFAFVGPAELDYSVIAINQQRLSDLLSHETYTRLIGFKKSHGVKTDTATLTRLRNHLVLLIEQLKSITDDPALSEIQIQQRLKAAEDHIILIALTLYEATENGIGQPKRLGNQHNYIVQRCHDYVTSSEGSCASVVDICESLHIPHRTLNYSFHKATGTSPMQYLRAVKLNAARRELLQTGLSITDIAANYGFFHMGYFSQEYRRLFGETPSMTRKLYA
ncbi:helix-turn-helix domain-containing protein [Methylophaga muralis]|uniref:Transcriptional activator NphR n=1 Tax=Methylophaga muralis TaxID=291169 RepID=A0A1E3GP41_9GAMM|nr:helix-turn-helix domain-containing protein [Methylophaga muralis]ODN65777.1 Transcriptional activator NphR [Methylophaga muralis]